MNDAASQFMSGVVEGFYGRPWNARQRHRLFGWMRQWGLNTYLYAPKDDLKHRLRWRELYDEAQAAELGALIRDCQRQGLKFIYALAPGWDLNYSRAFDLEAARLKLEQLAALGCRDWALLFDDIPTGLDGPDTERFKTLAAPQCSMANHLHAALREHGAAGEFLFCPTAYCGRLAGRSVKNSKYLIELGERLDPAIQVLWTGPEIIADMIPAESIREVQAVLKRKPVIWDNLHANDYDSSRIYLGPYSGRPLQLRGEVNGILCNPNVEFELNFMPLRIFAMFLQAEGSWDARAAYLAALNDWMPAFQIQGQPAVAISHLEYLGDCFYLPFALGKQAENLWRDLQWLLKASAASYAETERVLEICKCLSGLFNRVAAIDDRDLSFALHRHLWELKEEMNLFVAYLNWRRLQPAFGETFTSAEHRAKIYRGGFVAALQRLLPMDEAGQF